VSSFLKADAMGPFHPQKSYTAARKHNASHEVHKGDAIQCSLQYMAYVMTKGILQCSFQFSAVV